LPGIKRCFLLSLQTEVKFYLYYFELSFLLSVNRVQNPCL